MKKNQTTDYTEYTEQEGKERHATSELTYYQFHTNIRSNVLRVWVERGFLESKLSIELHRRDLLCI